MRINRNLILLIGLRATGDLGPWILWTGRRNRRAIALRSTPTTPPSLLQLRCRARWLAAARAWAGLLPGTRTLWALAARRAGLTISGYNLWMACQLGQRRDIITTIERQTGLTLL